MDRGIQAKILSMITSWIFTESGSALSAKEKTLFLLKFSYLENKAEQSLFDEYLNTILRYFKIGLLIMWLI